MLKAHNATRGKLNFNCSWHDPNDVDFYVTCPCGTQCGLGTRCDKCTGKSDLDMNFKTSHYDAINPVEHWFCDYPAAGIYKLMVEMYCANKSFEQNGTLHTGGNESSFTVTCTDKDQQIMQKFTGVVSESDNNQIFEFKWPHRFGINFNEHIAKFYPKWKGIHFTDSDAPEKLLYRQQSVQAVKVYGQHIIQEYGLV